jgi:hypothetical protein
VVRFYAERTKFRSREDFGHPSGKMPCLKADTIPYEAAWPAQPLIPCIPPVVEKHISSI